MLSKFVIEGGQPLRGTVRISGRKNAAVALIPAMLLADGPSTLENVPAISDAGVYAQILELLGTRVQWSETGEFSADPAGLAPREIPYEMAKRLRASYYLWGVLLARFGQADIPLPGGDEIGSRPVDQHLKALRALGAEIVVDRGTFHARAERLRGATIYLDIASVGATINTMLAATLAEGTTLLHNAAREPHVVDLANYLNAAGAKIHGAGTDTIRIHGVQSLRGHAHPVIPDDIEAATYMMAAAITGGEVTLENVITAHLDPVTAKLVECGMHIEENGDWIRVRGGPRPQGATIKTLPYPGFPTDAQSQMTTLLAVAEGTSYVTETLHEDRFRYVPELVRMGAHVRLEGRMAVVEGVPRLSGAPVMATDIRAGAALVLAGLAAEGTTVVSGVDHVERGYERMAEKLTALGARIGTMP